MPLPRGVLLGFAALTKLDVVPAAGLICLWWWWRCVTVGPVRSGTDASGRSCAARSLLRLGLITSHGACRAARHGTKPRVLRPQSLGCAELRSRRPYGVLGGWGTVIGVVVLLLIILVVAGIRARGRSGVADWGWPKTDPNGPGNRAHTDGRGALDAVRRPCDGSSPSGPPSSSPPSG